MKRHLAILIMVVMVLTIMSALASCEPECAHMLTKFEKTEATCTQKGNEEYYACTECGGFFTDAKAQNPISEPVVYEKLAHSDEDKNHKCDACDAIVGKHEAAVDKHTCDYCGETVTSCADVDFDHVCDVCGGAVGVHEAAKGKHTCDYCGKTVNTCTDADDHKCDICGETISVCDDADKNHACDVCGAEMGVHESATGGHSCDYCGGPVTPCGDENKDHVCEICGYPVGVHDGTDDSHICEYCGEIGSECVDADKDHACDVCGAKMGVHKPPTKGHCCEYCGYRYSECTPEADDGDCTTPVLCSKCDEVMVAAKEHDMDWKYNDNAHWGECANEGCNYSVPTTPHYSYKECECECGLVCDNDHCDICDGCLDDSCVLCNNKCEFRNMNKVIHFVPNANLGAPEGPDGKANGYTDIKDSLVAQQIVLPNGVKALLVTAPNGAAANSGASFLNNNGATIGVYGQNGYNCGMPLIDGKFTTVRMHFTNTGDSEVTFKFSNIDYYYDYGAAEVTLAAGETKTVLIKTSHGDSVGLNSQIVFTKAAAAGASVAMWGEFVANENLVSISVANPANKLQFAIGDTFSAEGLVLKANGTNYSRVYISTNYVTSLDGHTFTADDVGPQAVIVEFGGKMMYYLIEVSDHIHDIKYVEAVEPVKCEKDGFEAHYYCTVEGCGLYFADESGDKVVGAPKVISCHTAGDESKVLPGATIPCANCGAAAGVRDMTNWVLFNITTTVNSIGSDVKNAKLEKIELNGIPATKVYLGAGTKGGTGNNDIYLKMSSNDGDRQTVIPHLGSNAASGTTRTVILYYENYGSEPITMNLQNDSGSGNGMCKVTVPAHGTAIGTFSTSHKGGGSNWYHYYVDSSHNTDVSFAVYGYMYINDSEVTNGVSVSKAPKTTYNVGEAFTSEGLTLSTSIPGSKTITIRTGYTVDMEEGYVFTKDDIGTHNVTVSFAGKTTSYQITVKSPDTDCASGKHENVPVYDEALFVKMDGSDAIYNYKCAICGEVSNETYAAAKVSFVPHHNIGGGHRIEYVTLDDGRIASKLTFTSDVAAGTTYTITASSAPGGTNTCFPVRAERRAYMEMTSSADVNLTWQPEFYGDRDAFNFDLKAGETGSYSRTILYTGSQTSSDLPYQEIVCNSAVKAGTVVYMTGYFYAPGDVTGVTVNTPANNTIFKVGETFNCDGLTLKAQSSESLYSRVVIYNYTTNLDGYVFKEEDYGKLMTVEVYFGNVSTTYQIVIAR